MGMRRAPDGDAEQLVLSNINGATAWTLLEDFVELGEGDWVLQDAANSNVGRYLIVLAAKWGFRTVNLVRREEVRGELMDLGADAVILDGPDLPERIREATGGAEIRLGIDAIAGEAVMRMANCLADGGLIVNYGTLTDQPCQIDFWQMFLHDIRLCGMSTTRCFASRSEEEIDQLQNEIALMAADGRLERQDRRPLRPRSMAGKPSPTPAAPAPPATAKSSSAPTADPGSEAFQAARLPATASRKPSRSPSMCAIRSRSPATSLPRSDMSPRNSVPCSWMSPRSSARCFCMSPRNSVACFCSSPRSSFRIEVRSARSQANRPTISVARAICPIQSIRQVYMALRPRIARNRTCSCTTHVLMVRLP